MLTSTEVYDNAALAALIAGANLLGTNLKVGLNTAILQPSKQLTLSQMVEPTWTGYARQAVTWGTPFRDSTIGIVANSGLLTFQQTGTPVQTLVQGYFLAGGSSSGSLYAYEPFATPYQFVDDLDALTFFIKYIQSSTTQGFATLGF